VAYSQPRTDVPIGRGFHLHGRLDLATLQATGVPTDADFYLCGPSGFLRDMRAALTACDVLPEQVATEAFGSEEAHAPGIVGVGERPAPHPPAGASGVGPTVNFVRSSLATPWDSRFPSLLDLAEACDVPVSFGCRNGTCHSCESTLFEGEIEYTTDPLDRPPPGRVLLCCSVPRSVLALDC